MADINGESLQLVTLGGDCFEAAPRGVREYVDRDGVLYKFHLTDLANNRGKRLVSLFASGTLEVVVAKHKSRFGMVGINAIRRAFDDGVLSFDAAFDEHHYSELQLSESDFQAHRARTDPEIRQYIIHKAYWLAYRFPMQPQPTDVLYPIPFDEPADLDYLGVSSNEVRRNIQRLASQGLLEKILEGNARPTERLLSRYESGDRSVLGLSAADSTARAAHGEADDRKFERLAIEEARKSTPEDERVHPKVGVVVVKDGRVLATAHRGEIRQCHAEYIALEKKLPEEPLPGATVYTTLEPCTSRNHPKVPCATRLAERKVARVVIGMLDPDDRISGRGLRALRKAGIDTVLFPADLMAEVEELNRDFIREREAARALVILTGKGTNESRADELSPELLIDFEDGPSNIVPAEHKRGDKLASMIYVRVRVQNKGSAIAKGCRVYLTELKEVSPGGTAATALDDSKVLAWAGYQFSPLDIPPGGVFYADVVRFSKDGPGWLFSVEKLFAHQQKLKDYLGTYRFRVMAVAENAAGSFCEFDVTYNGDWQSLKAMPRNPQ